MRKFFPVGLMAITLLGLPNFAPAQTLLVIDDFSISGTNIMVAGESGNSVTASEADPSILGGQRDRTLTDLGVGTAGTSHQFVVNGGGIADGIEAAGGTVATFEIQYDANGMGLNEDFSGGLAFAFDVGSDNGTDLIITVNGSSTASVTVPAGGGGFGLNTVTVPFSAFSDPSVFNGTIDSVSVLFNSVAQTTSLHLSFDNFQVLAAPVPEPSSIALFALAVSGVGFYARRRGNRKCSL